MKENPNPYNKQEGDYVKDGLLICGKCNAPKVFKREVPLFEELGKEYVKYWPIACKCPNPEAERKREAEAARRAQGKIRELQSQGLMDRDCRKWTFANDKGYCPKQISIAKRYVENWPEMRDENIGLLFCGSCGTGKSYAACCIANALIAKGVLAVVTSLPKLISVIQSKWGDQREILQMISNAPLIVLDDLGTERDSSFGVEKAFEIVDTRIKSGKPMIVTTNLSIAEMDGAESIERTRIYDRIRGATVPVKCDGESIRKRLKAEKTVIAKEILGGK